MAVDGNFRWGGQGPGKASLNRWQLTRGRHEVTENHTQSIWRSTSSCTASSHAEKQEGRIHCGTQGDRAVEGEAGRGLFVEGLVGGGREVQVWPKTDRKTLWALFERSHFGFCMKYYLWKGQKYKNAIASCKHYSCTIVFPDCDFLCSLWLSNYVTRNVIENPPYTVLVFCRWKTMLLWLRLCGPGRNVPVSRRHVLDGFLKRPASSFIDPFPLMIAMGLPKCLHPLAVWI